MPAAPFFTSGPLDRSEVIRTVTPADERAAKFRAKNQPDISADRLRAQQDIVNQHYATQAELWTRREEWFLDVVNRNGINQMARIKHYNFGREIAAWVDRQVVNPVLTTATILQLCPSYIARLCNLRTLREIAALFNVQLPFFHRNRAA
jgi:hypothetical protein